MLKSIPKFKYEYNPLQIMPSAEGWKAVFIDYNVESAVPVLIPFPVIGWCLVERKEIVVFDGLRDTRKRRVITGMIAYEKGVMLVEELDDYEVYDEFMGFAGYLPPGGKLEDLQERAIGVREGYLIWEKRYFGENEAVSTACGNQVNNLKEVSHARSN